MINWTRQYADLSRPGMSHKHNLGHVFLLVALSCLMASSGVRAQYIWKMTHRPYVGTAQNPYAITAFSSAGNVCTVAGHADIAFSVLRSLPGTVVLAARLAPLVHKSQSTVSL